LDDPAAARLFAGHTGTVDEAHLARDHRWLFTASNADGLVRVWDAATGETIANLPYKGNIAKIELSADGRRALVVSAPNNGPAKASVWDISPSGALQPLQVQVTWPSLSNDSSSVNSNFDRMLVNGYGDASVALVDLNQGKVIKEIGRDRESN